MDILNPLSPSIDATFTTQSYPTDFKLSKDEKTIYLSDGENGFSILELDETTLTYKY